MEPLSDRLKAVRYERGLSQHDLARISSVSQSTIASLENGRAKGSKFLVLIASALAVDVEWLMTGEGDRERWDIAHHRESDDQPRRVEGAPGGPDRTLWVDWFSYEINPAGAIQWTTREEHAIGLSANVFRATRAHFEDCRGLAMQGDSMEPFLFDREMLVVDSTRVQPREAKVYALVFEGEQMVKQIFKQSGGALLLHSFNTKYPDRLIPAEHVDGLHIVGQCIYREGIGAAT